MMIPVKQVGQETSGEKHMSEERETEKKST
jgi:hypothetical protein